MRIFFLTFLIFSCQSRKQNHDHLPQKNSILGLGGLLTPNPHKLKPLKEILVINMDKSVDRWNRTSEGFKKEGLNVTRFPAVVGKNYESVYKTAPSIEGQMKFENVLQVLDEKKGYSYIFDTSQYRRMLSLGEIGNYLSIYEAYKKILRDHVEPVLLVEDDIVLMDHFKQRVETLMSYAPSDWDAIYLFCFGKSQDHPVVPNKRFVKLNPTDEHAAGNQAVVYNVKGVRKLIEGMMPITMPSDVRARKIFFNKENTGFHAYCALPEIVSTDEVESDIDAVDAGRSVK